MEIKIGIIGGMGPMATVEFLKTLTDATDANTDQEHVNYILYNIPEIPSRMDAFFHNGKTPVEDINRGIEFLSENGIQKIAMPCNTAHIWFREFEGQDKLFNMINLTVENIVRSGFQRVGILATTATLKSGLYVNDLKNQNLEVIIPDHEDMVMKAVELVKNGKIEDARRTILPVINEFKLKGCDSILMACTEMPVILNGKDTPLPLINSDRILAEAVIRAAGKKVRAMH